MTYHIEPFSSDVEAVKMCNTRLASGGVTYRFFLEIRFRIGSLEEAIYRFIGTLLWYLTTSPYETRIYSNFCDRTSPHEAISGEGMRFKCRLHRLEHLDQLGVASNNKERSAVSA